MAIILGKISPNIRMISVIINTCKSIAIDKSKLYCNAKFFVINAEIEASAILTIVLPVKIVFFIFSSCNCFLAYCVGAQL